MIQAKLRHKNTIHTCWLIDSKNRKIDVGYTITLKGEFEEKWEIIELHKHNIEAPNRNCQAGGLE